MNKEYLESFKTFNITFTDPSQKYNQVDRTVKVWANDEGHAENIISEYDSWKYNKKVLIPLPTGKHVKILNVDEIKEGETV